MGTRQEIGILLLILLLLLPWMLQQTRPQDSVAPNARAGNLRSGTCSRAFEVQGEVDTPGVICIDGQLQESGWQEAAGLPASCRDAKAPAAGSTLQISLGPGNECKLTHGPMPGIHRLLVGQPMDLNSAALEDLEAVPGIGPALAQRIHARIQQQGRFSSVDDLIQVKGIGPKRLVQFRPFFKVEPAPPANRPTIDTQPKVR